MQNLVERDGTELCHVFKLQLSRFQPHMSISMTDIPSATSMTEIGKNHLKIGSWQIEFIRVWWPKVVGQW